MSRERYCKNLRDELAKERTVLANERTLLAYIRTAIMLLASGITLVKLLRVDTGLRVIGFILIPVAFVVGVMGYRRYRKMRRELKMVVPEESID